MLAWACLSSRLAAEELKKPTLDAFDRYVKLTEDRIDSEVRRLDLFLWIDNLPRERRKAALEQLRQGKIVIERLETLADGQPIRVPGGLIHDWVGTVFAPGATLAQTMKLVQDYDRHQDIYKPEVVRSKLLRHEGNEFQIYLRLFKKKVISVVLNTEHRARYYPSDARHAYSRSYSTRIAEVENADRPDEREKPIGNDNGFLWRLYSYWRFEERDGGVYVECEAISLTRDVPAGLGWMVGPFIKSIPKESLSNTLNSTRAALGNTASRPL